MPHHLVPPLAALSLVALLSLRRAPPAVMLLALAVICTLAVVFRADQSTIVVGESSLQIRVQQPPFYTFLTRWTSASLSAAVWALLAALALGTCHFGIALAGEDERGVLAHDPAPDEGAGFPTWIKQG